MQWLLYDPTCRTVLRNAAVHRLRIRDLCLKFVKNREIYEIYEIRKNSYKFIVDIRKFLIQNLTAMFATKSWFELGGDECDNLNFMSFKIDNFKIRKKLWIFTKFKNSQNSNSQSVYLSIRLSVHPVLGRKVKGHMGWLNFRIDASSLTINVCSDIDTMQRCHTLRTLR